MPTDSPGVEQTPPDNVNLWTRDFSLITFATVLGAAGGIAGEFAISFFVFDETGSTLASALVIAIQLVPHVFVPLVISPFMDRLPRKAFLVAGDVVCGIAYAALGCWLAFSTFSYVAYLAVSLVLACLEAVDELAWTSIYPEVIPLGAEQKGYAVSSMLFTTLVVVMTPFAAVLLDTIGVARLLMIQGALAVEAEEMGEDGQVTAATYGQIFRESLYETQQERLYFIHALIVFLFGLSFVIACRLVHDGEHHKDKAHKAHYGCHADAAHAENLWIEDSLLASLTGHEDEAHDDDNHPDSQQDVVLLVKCKIVHIVY